MWVLGIKYGTHGDDAHISMARNGELLFAVEMSALFDVNDEAVRAELTAAQAARAEGLTGNGALGAADRARLSDHLALQAATGFANGCGGLFHTTAGVTMTCAEEGRTRERWAEAARRVEAASMALSRGGPRGGERLSYAAIFVAAEEDTWDAEGSPLRHAVAAFPAAEVWAMDDDCETAEPALVPWQLPGDATAGPAFWPAQSSVDKQAAAAAATTLDLPFRAHTSAILSGLLQQLREGGRPFSVLRPGYGWETTLAHRRLADPTAPISDFEKVENPHTP